MGKTWWTEFFLLGSSFWHLRRTSEAITAKSGDDLPIFTKLQSFQDNNFLNIHHPCKCNSWS